MHTHITRLAMRLDRLCCPSPSRLHKRRTNVCPEFSPQDCDFHPSQNIVLATTITGTAELFRYELEEEKKEGGITAEPMHAEQIHKVSCRAARFISSGDYFVTASLNKSMAAVSTETGKVLQRFKGAHEAAINRLAGTCLKGYTACLPLFSTANLLFCSIFLVPSYPQCSTRAWSPQEMTRAALGSGTRVNRPRQGSLMSSRSTRTSSLT